MSHKIAVFDPRILPDAQKQLRKLSDSPVDFPKERCTSEQEFIARTGNADIVLISPWDKVTKSYLNSCPNIQYIGLCGSSTANVDIAELEKRGIAFRNIVHRGKEPVAEFVFMQLVRLARGTGDYQWKTEERELMGKSIGIIGLGAVGQAMVHLALAYKMKTTYYSPHRKLEWEDRGVQYMQMDALMRSSVIIVVCSPTNVQVLGEHEFKLLPPGSIVVQASAGNPFDFKAFLAWIAEDGNFALFDKSASDESYHTYKDLVRVIYSESVAGDTYESNERRGQRAIENLKAYLENL